MPCDVVQTNTVDWKVADLETLEKGLRAAGFEVTRYGQQVNFRRGYGNWVSVRKESGDVFCRAGDEGLVNEAKRAYSAQVVRQTGQKFGWQVKQVGPNKFQYLKR